MSKNSTENQLQLADRLFKALQRHFEERKISVNNLDASIEKRINEKDWSVFFEKLWEGHNTLIEEMLAAFYKRFIAFDVVDFSKDEFTNLINNLCTYIIKSGQPIDKISHGWLLNLAACTGSESQFDIACDAVKSGGVKIDTLDYKSSSIINQYQISPLNFACRIKASSVCKYIFQKPEFEKIYASGLATSLSPLMDITTNEPTSGHQQIEELNIFQLFIDKNVLTDKTPKKENNPTPQTSFRNLVENKLKTIGKSPWIKPSEQLLARKLIFQLDKFDLNIKPTKRKAEELSFKNKLSMFLGFNSEWAHNAAIQYYKENELILDAYLKKQGHRLTNNSYTELIDIIDKVKQAILTNQKQESKYKIALNSPVSSKIKAHEILFFNELTKTVPEVKEVYDKLNIVYEALKVYEDQTSHKLYLLASSIAFACLIVAGLCIGVIARDKLPLSLAVNVNKLVSATKVENINKMFGGGTAAAMALAGLALGVVKGYDNYQHGMVGFLNHMFAEEAVKYCHTELEKSGGMLT